MTPKLDFWGAAPLAFSSPRLLNPRSMISRLRHIDSDALCATLTADQQRRASDVCSDGAAAACLSSHRHPPCAARQPAAVARRVPSAASASARRWTLRGCRCASRRGFVLLSQRVSCLLGSVIYRCSGCVSLRLCVSRLHGVRWHIGGARTHACPLVAPALAVQPPAQPAWHPARPTRVSQRRCHRV
jgi:hypothetical protein